MLQKKIVHVIGRCRLFGPRRIEECSSASAWKRLRLVDLAPFWNQQPLNQKHPHALMAARTALHQKAAPPHEAQRQRKKPSANRPSREGPPRRRGVFAKLGSRGRFRRKRCAAVCFRDSCFVHRRQSAIRQTDGSAPSTRLLPGSEPALRRAPQRHSVKLRLQVKRFLIVDVLKGVPFWVANTVLFSGVKALPPRLAR